MDRRGFLTGCAAAAGGLALLKNVTVAAEPPADKPFSKVKLRISAPIDFFPGASPIEKLDVVAQWGLPAYEWLGANGDAEALRKKADSLGLELSCTGGCGKIGPGTMVTVEDHDAVVASFKERVEFAKRANCKHLVGLTGNNRTDVSYDQQMENIIKCVKRLAPIAEQNDVILVMEALNPLVDHKGFFLTRTDQAVTILKEVNSPNVKMLFDIYHQQITEGNVIRNLTENIDYIGHFHVADNPGRKEPGTGELNYKNIFKAIASTNYKGFVALECGHSTKNYEDTLKATLACLESA
jgi:hydroxypyruvate isomerase